jgi:RHS repeat-associated protein
VENHLTAFGTEFTAGYRGDGLRAWVLEGGATTYYLYDGWRPVCTLNAGGTVTASYTFGANGLVAVGAEQVLCDWQGNAAHLWNGTSWSLGSVLPAYGAAGAGYNWQSGYLSDASDLVLCTYRFLDPSRGRWVTRDPIGYRGGIGLYEYVGNGPASGFDWTGFRCSGTTDNLNQCLACCYDKLEDAYQSCYDAKRQGAMVCLITSLVDPAAGLLCMAGVALVYMDCTNAADEHDEDCQIQCNTKFKCPTKTGNQAPA